MNTPVDAGFVPPEFCIQAVDFIEWLWRIGVEV
jgi:hypothetical protein